MRGTNGVLFRPIVLAVPALLLAAPAAPAGRATADCALCKKPLRAGREVRLEPDAGRTTIYRCVHCALTAQAAMDGPSTIHARSPVSGAPITIRRDETGWHVDPEGSLFLSLPEADGECIDRHLAFTGRDEFDRYLARHPELRRGPVHPYTIDEIADLLAAGLPARGIRPEAPVQLLVVGMLTHLPFKESVQPAIEQALQAAGPRAGARFVDATRPEGRAILAAHGIHEHLPVVMFLDGRSRFERDGRSIALRGFPGSTWTQRELADLLREAVRDSRK